jgi:hypothetical protein
VRVQATVAIIVLVLFTYHPTGAAADAASCLNACGNRCYLAGNQAAQSSCSQACTASCIAQGNGSPAPVVLWGAIFVATPPGGAIGWSFNANSSTQAQSIAAGNCADANHAPCQELITYFEKCGVAVQAFDPAGKILGAYGSARPVIADAETRALADCRQRFKGCKVVHKTCSQGGP